MRHGKDEIEMGFMLMLLCKTIGTEKVMKELEIFGKEAKLIGAPIMKEHPDLYAECFFYIQPIEEDTIVQRGIIIDVRKTDNEESFLFLGEDGKVHNDDDCVMGKDRGLIETYLKELREDL